MSQSHLSCKLLNITVKLNVLFALCSCCFCCVHETNCTKKKKLDKIQNISMVCLFKKMNFFEAFGGKFTLKWKFTHYLLTRMLLHNFTGNDHEVTWLLILPNVTEIRLSFQPDDSTVSAHPLDIFAWMKEHHLQLSLAKTELFVIPADPSVDHNITVQLGSTTLISTRTARNLGIVFDEQVFHQYPQSCRSLGKSDHSCKRTWHNSLSKLL